MFYLCGGSVFFNFIDIDLILQRRLRFYAIGTESTDVKIWSSAVTVVVARDAKEALKLSGVGNSEYVELEFFEILKHRHAIREFAANLFKGDLKI